MAKLGLPKSLENGQKSGNFEKDVDRMFTLLNNALISGQTLVKIDTRKMIFLFLNQNICCGYSKEPSQWDGSFEHPKYMLKKMGKKIFTILR